MLVYQIEIPCCTAYQARLTGFEAVVEPVSATSGSINRSFNGGVGKQSCPLQRTNIGINIGQGFSRGVGLQSFQSGTEVQPCTYMMPVRIGLQILADTCRSDGGVTLDLTIAMNSHHRASWRLPLPQRVFLYCWLEANSAGFDAVGNL